MAEKWKEIYSEEQIKKIQEIEIRNLKEIKRVCEKIGVEFFLYGGSLIGAVRHKGFVPWDDDLDIAMSRDDYMKFVKEAPKYLSDEYYLQTPYTDKKSPYFYSKLRLKGTKCIEYAHYKLGIEQGIYVDIYPIDKMPDNNEEYLRLYNQFQKTIRLFVLRQSPTPETAPTCLKRRIRNLMKFVVGIALHIIPHSLFVNKLDNIMTQYNNKTTKRYGNYSYFDPVNLFKDIYPLQKGIFENIVVNLPNNWDYHLSTRYGNYMEFPPEEERIGHKPYILDFGNY